MIEVTADFIFIKSNYEDYNKMKYTLNGSWSAAKKSWRFPKSTFVLDEIAHALPAHAKTKEFSEARASLEAARANLKQAKHAQPTHAHDRLRPYQHQDVQYLSRIPSAGVFNQPRTGKTPTMIETIKARATYRNMIICPASLQYNWKAEIERWHEGSRVIMFSGKATERRKAAIQFMEETQTPTYLIVSKDLAKKEVMALSFAHDVCVVDEAHFLRNRDTMQSKAVRAIGSKAAHRYALTGTPAVKHPSDVFGILQFLYPKKFSSYWDFINRYFDTRDNGFGTEITTTKKHREEELKDLLDAVSTQRLRKDVMQWLPDKQYHQHRCMMSDKQFDAYESMLKDFFVQFEDTIIDTQNVLAQLTRLRQLCLDPALLGLNIPSAKTEALIEAIEDGTYDEPLVIMSMFSAYFQIIKPRLEKLGKRVGEIHGKMTNSQKDEMSKAFQRGELDVLLCNIISAGVGFTLDRGEVVIFMDKAWNPAENEQAEDRVCPTSVEKVHKHFVVSMICTGTIDERIDSMLTNKKHMNEIINKCKNVDELKMLLL